MAEKSLSQPKTGAKFDLTRLRARDMQAYWDSLRENSITKAAAVLAQVAVSVPDGHSFEPRDAEGWLDISYDLFGQVLVEFQREVAEVSKK